MKDEKSIQSGRCAKQVSDRIVSSSVCFGSACSWTAGTQHAKSVKQRIVSLWVCFDLACSWTAEVMSWT